MNPANGGIFFAPKKAFRGFKIDLDKIITAYCKNVLYLLVKVLLQTCKFFRRFKKS